MYHQLPLFYEPRSAVCARLDMPAGEPEMSEFESAFLCGALKAYRPKNILEVGIAAGGTSAIIMECMSALDAPCHITSVDLNEKFYRDERKNSGFLADDYRQFAAPSVSQEILTEKLAHEQLAEWGGGGISRKISKNPPRKRAPLAQKPANGRSLTA